MIFDDDNVIDDDDDDDDDIGLRLVGLVGMECTCILD